MPFVLLPLATLALAAWVTWLAIHYAIRRRLVDLPGERRSHQVTTPRGGGVGIVASQVFVPFWLSCTPLTRSRCWSSRRGCCWWRESAGGTIIGHFPRYHGWVFTCLHR
jgi:UDP-N-acetylmuramyl pentapeptide phosphotransferase/UDP-N-acetylglucosamine-1-phosphate transferase